MSNNYTPEKGEQDNVMAYVTKTLKQKYCSTSKMQLKHLYQRTNVSKNTSTIYRQGGI